MPASLIPQPPTPSQNFLPRSMSCAGNSTCTTRLPMLDLLSRLKLYAPTLSDEREAKWFARSSSTTNSPKAPPRATITLNRPEVLNAFDFRMLREITRACEDASWDDDIRVVVVTGNGRAFCVGADLKSWSADYLGKPREYWKWFGAFKDMHDKLREIGKPTLARINGIAVGGGNELQMACDLAVMAEDAFIRHVGLEHGSVPAGGATQEAVKAFLNRSS